jgi:hypothetical protein
MMDKAGFKLTRGTGFHITFENGWTASVQFGAGTYSDNHDAFIIGRENDPKYGEHESSTAEIAAWDSNHKWYEFENDRVDGYVTPAEVLEFFNTIAAMEPATTEVSLNDNPIRP